MSFSVYNQFDRVILTDGAKCVALLSSITFFHSPHIKGQHQHPTSEQVLIETSHSEEHQKRKWGRAISKNSKHR